VAIGRLGLELGLELGLVLEEENGGDYSRV
jgi:hypothetical protein